MGIPFKGNAMFSEMMQLKRRYSQAGVALPDNSSRWTLTSQSSSFHVRTPLHRPQCLLLLLLLWGLSTVTMPTVQEDPATEKTYGGVGRCKCSFWFAVAHDILGVFIIMVGVFGGLEIHDLFVYAGAIIIFLSLIWWVFWYTGNIDVPPTELEDDVGLLKLKKSGISQVVRRVSDRLSNGIRNSFRRKGQPVREGPAGDTRPASTGTDVSLSTIHVSTNPSSSKEFLREPLSV